MFHVNIYLETTVKSANVGTGYYGYVVEYILQKKNEPATRVGIEREINITANQLYLMACYRALEILEKPCDITIYTDSTYIQNGINTWMHQWYQTDWINAKGEHVKNKDLWKPLHALAKNHLIRVESVRAHNYSVWLRDEIRKREAAD
jgi:ribonuclease HI